MSGGDWMIHFDFDCEGEPPAVFIVDDEGTSWLEVLEDPTLSDSATGKDSEGEPWSWDPEDWTPGPLATKLLELMAEVVIE